MPKQPPIWRMPPFIALFADPFIAGTELEGGHIAYSCMQISFLLKRLLTQNDDESINDNTSSDDDNNGHGIQSASQPSLFDANDFEKLKLVKDAVDKCLKIAAAQVQKPEDFFKILKEIQQDIEQLNFGEMLMVPGGWNGATTRGSVVHLIEKMQGSNGEVSYSFITCNSGEGLEYHLSKPDEDIQSGKLKYKTCLRINNIPLERMMDNAFWMNLLAQRMKEPASENQRSEMLYDVLLPWLAGDRLISTVLAEEQANNDPFSDWRTPARSNTSHYRSVWEAARYMCRWHGLSHIKMKQFSFRMRQDMLVKTMEDLKIFDDPQKTFRGYSVGPGRSIQEVISSAGDFVNGNGETVSQRIMDGKVVIGLYFSGHWCAPCRQFTPVLAEWYARLQQQGKDFLMIFVSADRDQNAFNEYARTMPWPAIRFEQQEARQELSALCSVEGVPTLALLDQDRNLMTNKGRDIVNEDPEGQRFPWNELAEEAEPRVITVADMKILKYACEQTAVSALKENDSKRFTTKELDALNTFLNSIETKVKTLPMSDDVASSEPTLHEKLGDISSILTPSFPNFELLNMNGMDKYAGNASQQPTPQLANMLEMPEKVHTAEEAEVALSKCLSIVRKLLQRAQDGSSSSRLVLQYEVIHLIGDLFTKVLPIPHPSTVASAMGMGGMVKADIQDNSAKEAAEAAKIAAQKSQQEAERLAKEKEERDAKSRMELAMQLMQFFPQFSFELAQGALELNGDNIEYAGNWLIANSTRAFELIAEARAAKAASKSNDSPNNNALISGNDPYGINAAAAAAIENDVLSGPNEDAAYRFRSRVFILPNNGKPECIWSKPLTKDLQMKILQSVHRLTMLYATMWQAIESPSRGFDSERSCVSLCMLAIFDAAIRMPAIDKASVVSQILGEDGGYALSTDVCQNNRNIDKIGATMELHVPHMHNARSAALEYLSAMRRSCTKTIFNFRQPQKIEIKKYSTTCSFLKRVLARCGYPLIPREAQRPPPEIEALCNWLFEDSTPLASKQPEFGMMRNMVALYKFLSTMQTREHELMSRKQLRDNIMMSFSFSFEEGGRRAAWNISMNPLRWDVVGFRGAPDKDTADVDCIGFYGRKLFFGEGLVVQSPCDVSKYLEIEMPTEDDVLHADDLPTFNDTLSREEAELLFSFLTVDYVRLPLLLNFFAEKDRVTYLFNAELQDLLKGVLFEGGPWVPDWELQRIQRVPERRTYKQTQKEARDRFLRAELPPNRELLGTSSGLLINELIHAPDAVLRPILKMLYAIEELTKSAVHSPDASFIIYMISLIFDVQKYINYVVEKSNRKDTDIDNVLVGKIATLVEYKSKFQNFMETTVAGVLSRWCNEAENLNDMPTACVIHAYNAILWSNAISNINEATITEELMINILGSLTFVRNWHGFGMGLLRSNFDNTTEPIDRLIRFLQAHGIDTSRTDRKSLAKWTTGGRPLYLRVGREVVRAPTFANPELDKNKLPPAELPEAALLLMLQHKRRPIVKWFASCNAARLDRILNSIMAIALKNKTFEFDGWKQQCVGNYVAESIELKFDIQSAEVLWRNDELRPVPDSMVQYNDYDSLFGREPLHCGIVRREEHRLWVHLVGKNCDLAEWDEPKTMDQGIGMPTKIVVEVHQPLFWSCAACTMFNEGGTACNVCGTARPGANNNQGAGSGGQKEGGGEEGPPEPLPSRYMDIEYTREFDPYSEKPHEHASEQWFVDLLKSAILVEFPPEKPMKYKLMLPGDPYTETCDMVRLVGCANVDKGNMTWKEVQILKSPPVVHIFNLLPHGRRAYRSLIYTSDSRFSYHSLPVKVGAQNGPVPKEVQYSAGDLKEYRKPSGSLVIMRQNDIHGGRETYIPARLLQGVVPTVLLEAFRFWQDEKNCLSGEALDEVSQWFNFHVKVELNDNKSKILNAKISRYATKSAEKKSGMSQKAKTAVSLLRQSSLGRNVDEVSDEIENSLLQLVNLGFTPASAKLALKRNASDPERAATWLFDEANASIIDAVNISEEANSNNSNSLSAPPLKRTNSFTEKIDILVSEGHQDKLAEYALSMFRGEENALELSRIWLSQENRESFLQKNSNLAPESKADNDGDADIEMLEEEKDEDVMILVDLLDPKNAKNEILTKLRNLLTRIEDISHILVWGEETNDTSLKIVLIELPRLKLRFVQNMHPDGFMRLHVADADEWFVTDYYSIGEEEDDNTILLEQKSILQHLIGLPHSLLLQNQADEFQILLCNHDVHRPLVRGIPFSTNLVFDRSSTTWQEVMERRYFILPIHTSKSFLITTTLSARLYLILLKLLARQYEEAYRLIDVCAIDTKFTAEEKWVFNLIQERTKFDLHPDAEAVRLKLILAIMYSTNEMMWETNRIFQKYLKNVAHVSAACRLSHVEEKNLLILCKVANASLKNRLAVLMADEKKQDTVELKGRSPRIGGQPWWKLAILQPTYIAERLRSKMHYVQYALPETQYPNLMKDDEIFKFLWKEELMLDEENGANRQLGIIFLYQMIQNEFKLVLGGNDCTRSFAEIFTRSFHLKHARWGREAVNEGEQDAEVSREMIQLITRLNNSQRQWPAVPKDSASVELLKQGIDLHGASRQRQMSRRFLGANGMFNRNRSVHDDAQMVKLFFQFLDAEFKQTVQCDEHSKMIATKQQEMANSSRLEHVLNINMMLERAKSSKNNTESIVISSKALPVKVSDFGLHVRKLVIASGSNGEERKYRDPNDTTGGISKQDSEYFSNQPIGAILLNDLITFDSIADEVSPNLPFDVSKNTESQTPIAADMMKRLAADKKGFAKSQEGRLDPKVVGLKNDDIDALSGDQWTKSYENATNTLNILINRVMQLRDSDREIVAKNVKLVETDVTIIPDLNLNGDDNKESDEERTRFRLLRLARQRPFLDITYVTSMIMSTTSRDDILNINPYIKNPEIILNNVEEILLRVSRVRHGNRIIESAKKMKKLLNSMKLQREDNVKGDNLKELLTYMKIQSQSLGKAVCTKRYFIDQDSLEYDPRFLVFEYVFDIILRKRQVEIVTSFYQSILDGDSRVQQMIMGAGKTTVVGPLLTLMLANGKQLIMQVMPSALLQQTKDVMKSCFSTAILPKKVFTLEFERSVEDSAEFVSKLYAKLNDARKSRCVVCAAPEAIKSLALKFVEHLHSIEEFDTNLLIPGNSVRENEIALDMKDKMIAKSDMADSLVKILDMWKQGVLIMDEVDVLLHPLRSELNFPIGHKYPIDLSGYRWNLPIHLCDAIFYAESGKLSDEPNVKAYEALQIDYNEILERLATVIRKGYQVHAIQRSPHLVLLDLKFYHSKMKPLIVQWVLGWLQHHFVGRCSVKSEILTAYLMGIQKDERKKYAAVLEVGMSSETMKLLNLACDWVQTLLPHVLSKINRVSFGILTPADLAVADPRMPFSRRVMAVPFVGKDVPSRSSEFAHPDVLIGLTVIAYRYSGLRRKDLQRIVMQLKQDYTRQIGPRTDRPAAMLFRRWLDLAVEQSPSNSPKRGKSETRSLAVLPLPLFQPTDPVQLNRLYGLVRKLPELLHYFLRNHIFPKTMNFQKLKVSACGHELGSSLLFSSRVGFSGTPSNLLPMDLGECQYEPGSDGRIVHVLSSHRICKVTPKTSWTAQSLLKDIAKQTDPPVHALIDTGALITGMDNREVAEFLMLHLHENMEGVVYLDRSDRKMVLMRQSGRAVSIEQCGIRPEKRFTFYDQVHTTGMDIKQGPTAHAVVTVGKDMTFRDYAQGSYRMRGIGIGQTIEIYLIPEVINRIKEELESPTGDYLYDVPAWLLLNSMRMEGLQFVQLSLQELHNIWRKRAIGSLIDEVHVKSSLFTKGMEDGLKRLHRFNANVWLQNSINVFREPIGFPVEDKVPRPRPFVESIKELVDEHKEFLIDDIEIKRVDNVKSRVKATTGVTMSGDDGNAALNSEVVHENEKQQEEEAQKQVRQEKIKQNAYSRDDEEPKPWKVEVLSHPPSSELKMAHLSGASPFYPALEFQTRKDLKKLPFPSDLMITDNFFRPSWIGIGDRRLKNIALVLEWVPLLEAIDNDPKVLMKKIFTDLVKNGVAANEAAAMALRMIAAGELPPRAPQKNPSRYFIALSLAEGETLRRMIHDHTRQPILKEAHIAIRTIGGRLLDASPGFNKSKDSDNVLSNFCCFRFFNTDMYYSEREIKCLSKALVLAPIDDRLAFFEEGLRLRSRERNLWADTPVAKLFTDESEWHLLGARSLADNLRGVLRGIHLDGGNIPGTTLIHIFASVAQKEARSVALGVKSNVGVKESRGVHSWTPSENTLVDCIYTLYGLDGFLNTESLMRLCVDLKVQVKLVDVVQMFHMLESENPDKLNLAEFVKAFPVALKHAHLPKECAMGTAIVEKNEVWLCLGCTFANSIANETCALCNLGWDGRRQVPRDQWECSQMEGGCTKYNHNDKFYCEVCGKARPNLKSVRF